MIMRSVCFKNIPLQNILHYFAYNVIRVLYDLFELNLASDKLVDSYCTVLMLKLLFAIKVSNS